MKGIFLKSIAIPGIVLSAVAGMASMAEAATVTQSQLLSGFANETGFAPTNHRRVTFSSLSGTGQNGVLSIKVLGDFDETSEWVSVVLDPDDINLDLGQLFDSLPSNDDWSIFGNAEEIGPQYGSEVTATASIPDAILNSLLGKGTFDALISFSPDVENLDNMSEEFIALSLTYDATPIPTPALLPGLIGMGVAALRRKQQDKL